MEYYRDQLGHRKPVEVGFASTFLPVMPKHDDDVEAGLEAPISVQETERAIADLGPDK